jgi:hypothetical protein
MEKFAQSAARGGGIAFFGGNQGLIDLAALQLPL